MDHYYATKSLETYIYPLSQMLFHFHIVLMLQRLSSSSSIRNGQFCRESEHKVHILVFALLAYKHTYFLQLGLYYITGLSSITFFEIGRFT